LAFAGARTLVGLGPTSLWSVDAETGKKRFVVAMSQPPTSLVADARDAVVVSPGALDVVAMSDGRQRSHLDVDASMLFAALTDRRLFVASSGRDSRMTAYDRELNVLATLRVTTSGTILISAKELVQVVGDDSGLVCAVDHLRLPLAACDGVRVSPGPGDLFSALF